MAKIIILHQLINILSEVNITSHLAYHIASESLRQEINRTTQGAWLVVEKVPLKCNLFLIVQCQPSENGLKYLTCRAISFSSDGFFSVGAARGVIFRKLFLSGPSALLLRL